MVARRVATIKQKELVYFTKEIVLTKGFSSLVDDEDYDVLCKYNWHYSNGYARGRVSKKDILMHRFIMNAPKGKVIDHINGNRLDNRKINLRICDQKDNSRNRRNDNRIMSSKYKGVTKYSKSDLLWVCRITVDNETIELGKFKSEIACANAYNYYASNYFGEYAKLNEVPFMKKWNGNHL